MRGGSFSVRRSDAIVLARNSMWYYKSRVRFVKSHETPGQERCDCHLWSEEEQHGRTSGPLSCGDFLLECHHHAEVQHLRLTSHDRVPQCALHLGLSNGSLSHVSETQSCRASVITSLNLKGGVGKTHLCWLARLSCQERGHRCLIVDLDQQAQYHPELLARSFRAYRHRAFVRSDGQCATARPDSPDGIRAHRHHPGDRPFSPGKTSPSASNGRNIGSTPALCRRLG